MSAQTFIFCLGATKAGTSWLFDYLYGHEECHFSTAKELHYFDAIESGHGGFYRNHALNRLKRARRDISDPNGPHATAYTKQVVADLERWTALFDGETRDDSMYLDYVRSGGKDARVIGDFTPAYGLLTEKTLEIMANLTSKVRFIYLMRDPVDRLWSNIRMAVGSRKKEALDSKLDAVLQGQAEAIMERSNYRRTLNRVSKVVSSENIHIEYYERLFTEEAIERLCGFLGIASRPAQFDRVIHKSFKADLTDERRSQLQIVLKPQYNFVEKFMGELPSEWTQKMVSA